MMNIFKRNKNKKFWDWFSKNSNAYFQFESNQEALFDELSRRLKGVSRYACFELGPVVDGRRDFIISADGVLQAAQAVIDLVSDAPELDHWTIIAFRPRMDVGRIDMEGRVLRVNDIRYTYAFNEHNRIDLSLYIKGFSERERQAFAGATYVLIDALVGEYDAMTKIGAVEFHDAKAVPGKGVYSLQCLPTLIDSRRSNELQ